MCVGNAYTLEGGWNKFAGGLGNGRKAMSLNRQLSRPLFYLTELRALSKGQKVFWVPHETEENTTTSREMVTKCHYNYRNNLGSKYK
jgi:hypothetical protein